MDACFNAILSLKAFIVNATAYLLVAIKAEDPRLWIDGRGYKMEESDSGHPAIAKTAGNSISEVPCI